MNAKHGPNFHGLSDVNILRCGLNYIIGFAEASRYSRQTGDRIAEIARETLASADKAKASE